MAGWEPEVCEAMVGKVGKDGTEVHLGAVCVRTELLQAGVLQRKQRDGSSFCCLRYSSSQKTGLLSSSADVSAHVALLRTRQFRLTHLFFSQDGRTALHLLTATCDAVTLAHLTPSGWRWHRSSRSCIASRDFSSKQKLRSGAQMSIHATQHQEPEPSLRCNPS